MNVSPKVTNSSDGITKSEGPRWSAVFAMALCVAVLIASEFMPVSLLSPIAHDLGLTEGQAGQAIAISGIFAVLTSLFITVIAGRLDRRIVLIVFTSLTVFSGVVVAFAPNYLTLMAGRALLGVTIGGFWSMSAAMIMRLVPAESVPRGLAIIYGGNALASAIAAPMGSFMGGLLGWRWAFFSVIPVAVTALIWQALTLPPLPAHNDSGSKGMLKLFRNRVVALGMLAVMLSFMGQFALFTYLRPFLEQVTGVNVSMLTWMLLIVGLTGLIGTSFVSRFLDGRLHTTLVVIPVAMAATAIAMAVFGASTWITAALLAVWGILSTAAPVAWSTWLTRTLPENAEAGGGLMVAIIQLGITVGAAGGGVVFDSLGGSVTFLGSAGILVLSGLVAVVARNVSTCQPVREGSRQPRKALLAVGRPSCAGTSLSS
ncbi:MAG: transcriptional regulator [Chthoniobacteraceae bacterium]|nr:transcriptional regulator [Chthoniobacteraceae bacterium]